jgi:hypothetical protein
LNKKFIQNLVAKPNNYLLVWGYIFSRFDEQNKASIYLYEIYAKYKVPKSTLKRIVDYGVSISGLEMDYKWISNTLHISILGDVSESKVVHNRTKNEPKVVAKRAKPKANSLYSKMIELYDNFCQKNTGVGGKIDGMQGKAMKSIIIFLTKQCSRKNSNLNKEELDENVLLSWEYILNNWDKLDDYNRSRIKLSDINSSMLNILMKLKEQPINKKQKQRYEQINQAVKGASNTDYSGLGTGK